MPYYPEDETEDIRHGFELHSSLHRLIAEYANIPIGEVENLDIIDYMILRFDAYVSALNRTKSGQEYLVNAWCRIQTEPDRDALRPFMKKGGAVGGRR